MFFVGNCYVNYLVFNLFVGCEMEWSFFEVCILLSLILEFVLFDLLSCFLLEYVIVLWIKVLWKFSEVLEGEIFLLLLMLWVMLVCCILIILEKNEFIKLLLRLNEKGKNLVRMILFCLYSGFCVWLVSSIFFYVIFDWMKCVWMVDEVLIFLRVLNIEWVEKVGYRLVEVWLKEYDIIEMDLVLFCRYKLMV